MWAIPGTAEWLQAYMLSEASPQMGSPVLMAGEHARATQHPETLLVSCHDAPLHQAVLRESSLPTWLVMHCMHLLHDACVHVSMRHLEALSSTCVMQAWQGLCPKMGCHLLYASEPRSVC